MKSSVPVRRGSWCLALVVWLGCSLLLPLSAEDRPRIVAVQLHGTDVVVTCAVPAGVRKISLESRRRLGPGGWEPRAVMRSDGRGGEVEFRLPRTEAAEVLRVRGDATDPLPAAFYRGTNFSGVQPFGGGYGYGFMAGPGDARGNEPPEAGGEREVVESDIWKLQGDTLYFFNQYRGLQVIDLSTPDTPVLTGSLALPAAGEQMYVLSGGEVVLLARDGCAWWGSGGESQVMVVTVAGGTPKLAATRPIEGEIRESRLVGSALYVAAQVYRAVPGSSGTTWEWGTQVTAFDLATPTAPVARNSLWYPGYNLTVAATDRFCFVVTQLQEDWRRSEVHLIDIAAPDGTMRPLGRVAAAGLVRDKFKLHVSGEVLTVISEVQTNPLITRLQTFSVADPLAPRPLGELALGESERLHATRFAGDRVYVVTFFVRFQMDPLWVVDLSTPERPTITGQLEIPGWSTYLQPWGDKLVAAGIETNRTTVSLFDVADPARPALLDRVSLGTGWSWSEANNDEKAFNVLTDDGLILLPYQSWSDGAAQSRVQLIDLRPDTLVLRGAIDHTFTPRRATLHAGRILSVSGRELLSVDARNRDEPRVAARLDLAWPVDVVIPVGEHLLEVARGSAWPGDATPPAVRVARAGAPDAVLGVAPLRADDPIVAATAHEGRLYVAQLKVEAAPTPPSGDGPAPEPNLELSVFDLGALPAVTRLGTVRVAVEALAWGASLEAAWPKPNVLVLAGGGYGSPWLGGVARPTDGAWFRWPGYWGGSGGGGRFLAFNVADPARPGFASDVNLTTNGWWNFSTVQTADGRVMVSHQMTEPAPPQITPTGAGGEPGIIFPPEWLQVQRTYLDVVDYADPADPLVRRPLEIPGSLVGVSHAGSVLYTVGMRWRPDGNWNSDPTEYFDASAYDGVSVRPIDTIVLPPWPRPVALRGPDIFLGRADAAGGVGGLVASWRLNDEGKLVQVGTLKLDVAAQNLAIVDTLLAVQSGEGVLVFGADDPTQLPPVGGGSPPGCIWIDLTRAAGGRPGGLWFPLGWNGVWQIQLPAAP